MIKVTLQIKEKKMDCSTNSIRATGYLYGKHKIVFSSHTTYKSKLLKDHNLNIERNVGKVLEEIIGDSHTRTGKYSTSY